MSTVTVDYFGMSGTGRTVTEAKKDAGVKITRALDGSYSPTILAHRGYVVLVVRTPFGWDMLTIAEPNGEVRTGRLHPHGNYQSEADAVRSGRDHLAQLGWTPADGLTVPDILTDKESRSEFLRWVRFQLRYQLARAAGLSDSECHQFGGGWWHTGEKPAWWDTIPVPAELAV